MTPSGFSGDDPEGVLNKMNLRFLPVVRELRPHTHAGKHPFHLPTKSTFLGAGGLRVQRAMASARTEDRLRPSTSAISSATRPTTRSSRLLLANCPTWWDVPPP
jgi:hypothetical protein